MGHFLTPKGAFTLKERLDFEIEHRNKLAIAVGGLGPVTLKEKISKLRAKIDKVERASNGKDFFMKSAPSDDFESELFRAIEEDCEGSIKSENTYDPEQKTCLRQDGSYGGSR